MYVAHSTPRIITTTSGLVYFEKNFVWHATAFHVLLLIALHDDTAYESKDLWFGLQVDDSQ